MHVKSNHEQTKQFVRCDVPECKKLFENDIMLRRHVQLVHAHECVACGATFDSRDELSAHRQSHVGTLLQCNFDGCTKVFKNASALVAHKKSVINFSGCFVSRDVCKRLVCCRNTKAKRSVVRCPVVARYTIKARRYVDICCGTKIPPKNRRCRAQRRR